MVSYRTKLQRRGTLLTALLFLGAAILFAMTLKNLQTRPANASVRTSFQLVIDPGHGGIDGGAIGFDGTKESDINLSIAIRLRDLADFLGLHPTMTRSDDSKRTDILSYSEHEELVYRAQIANAVPGAALISIHQNSYPTSQPSGAQVLYARNEPSRLWGELTHDSIVRYLQTGNRRVAEPADKRLYLTANVRGPTILVECGFMSNPFDLEQLQDGSYQTSLAAVLLSAFCRFSTSGEKT